MQGLKSLRSYRGKKRKNDSEGQDNQDSSNNDQRDNYEYQDISLYVNFLNAQGYIIPEYERDVDSDSIDSDELVPLGQTNVNVNSHIVF